MKPQSVDFVVVANLLLIPSQDIFLPLGSNVRYTAEIVKQSVTKGRIFIFRSFKVCFFNLPYKLGIYFGTIFMLYDNTYIFHVAAIQLPSKQYQLSIKDEEICSLNPSSSIVTAINYGTTEISLTDES